MLIFSHQSDFLDTGSPGIQANNALIIFTCFSLNTSIYGIFNQVWWKRSKQKTELTIILTFSRQNDVHGHSVTGIFRVTNRLKALFLVMFSFS